MYQLSYHFREIRLRFFYIVFSLILTLITSYYYQLEILYIIGRPFLNMDHKFILIDLTEAFSTLLRICGIFSFFIIIPFSLYHLWSFYIPSRYNFERKTLTLFSLLFFLFLLLEILLLYFLIFPLVCEFLLSFDIISSNTSSLNNESISSFLNQGTERGNSLLTDRGLSLSIDKDKGELPVILELTARLESYVKLSTRFYSSMLLLFQIPFLVIVFYYYKIIDCYALCKMRKFFLFSSLLVSAFISPPDILSQSIIASLLFSFYEILIIIGFFYSFLMFLYSKKQHTLKENKKENK